MPDPPIRVDPSADRARLRVIIDRPPGNLLSLEVVNAFRSALGAISGDDPLKLLTVEGAGADFSFGAMIGEHAPGAIGRVLPQTHNLIRDLLDAPVTTAAVVRGRCLGGGFELALACDFIFAAEGASFGLPEIGLGGFPPAACALLPLRTGTSVATESIITGEPRSAEAWKAAGLIAVVAPADGLDREVERWFDRHLRPRSAAALRHAAKAARLVLRAQAEPALMEAERLYLERLMRTRDAAEGVTAFLEKRSPQWTDT